MATRVAPNPFEASQERPLRRSRPEISPIERVLHALASLKLTVALFAMAIFIIWAGTLAQKESGVWAGDRAIFSHLVRLRRIQSVLLFHGQAAGLDGRILFPRRTVDRLRDGCRTCSRPMLCRFKLQAKDWRLPAGLAVIAAGVGLFLLVVIAGNHLSGVQAGSPVDWSTLWFIMKLGLAAVVGGCVARLAMMDWSRSFERNLLLAAHGVLGQRWLGCSIATISCPILPRCGSSGS